MAGLFVADNSGRPDEFPDDRDDHDDHDGGNIDVANVAAVVIAASAVGTFALESMERSPFSSDGGGDHEDPQSAHGPFG